MSDSDPFERDGFLDEPGVIGARWWQASTAEAAEGVTRRNLLGKVLGYGVAITAVGAYIGYLASDDYETVPRNALEMQREYGWNFGAASDALVFDGVSYQAWAPDAIARMAEDCAPRGSRHRPFWSPTLFQSPTAMPSKSAPGDPATFKPLAEVLRPIDTPAMALAFARGKSLAELLARLSGSVAVVIDLPGPESVAFAAGMRDRFDAVFAFENWPHPRGVVPAHLTLAAAAFFQPLFAKASAASAPPAVVLDRNRLAPYTDEQNQFDNRFVAKLPSASSLKSQGIERVLYVTPLPTDAQEMDDVNDDLVAWLKSGLDVAMVGAGSFVAVSGEGKDATCLYGGSPETHEGFYLDYPWAPAKTGSRRPSSSAATRYRPAPRKSAYSSGTGAKTVTKTPPVSFGLVPVVVVAGVIQGAKLSRSGSWNRASSGGWGG